MSNAMNVASQRDAIATGAIVLKVGGNAVDAAIACALVQTVVAPLINILSYNCECLAEMVRELGVCSFIRFVRETLSDPWLDPFWVQKRLATPFQIRLMET